ncbi:hypothetical protein [Couchioplanes caeruleus]|uniref:hypothetical protein n=1 Tax=Couchioplanes caeruleus TaxID=56438 RepID=UPI0011609CAD|nr:hypothetical protein [Couchioplanes caeruleus]
MLIGHVSSIAQTEEGPVPFGRILLPPSVHGEQRRPTHAVIGRLLPDLPKVVRRSGQESQCCPCQHPDLIPFRSPGQGLDLPQAGVVLSAHETEVLVDLGQYGQRRGVQPATLDEGRYQPETVVKLQRQLVHQWETFLSEPSDLRVALQGKHGDTTDESGNESGAGLFHEISLLARPEG